MTEGAPLPKVASAEGRRHLARRSAATGLIRIRPEAPGSPSCGLEVGPWGEVMNQIRKVIEGMHLKMHDEPSVTIGSHRGKVCQKAGILTESLTMFRMSIFYF